MIKSFEQSFTDIPTQLTDGFHYLHSNQIADCDLKPSNVLVTKENYSILNSLDSQFQEKYEMEKIISKHSTKNEV